MVIVCHKYVYAVTIGGLNDQPIGRKDAWSRTLRGTKTRLARKDIAGVHREVIASAYDVVRYFRLSRPQMTGHAERVVIKSMDVVGC